MIDIRGLCVSFGGRPVLSGCSLHVPDGGRVALMGPSGCGKTTLINAVAGLLRPDAGTVDLHGGRVAYVFQEPRLLPWLTAAENVNLVLSDGAATLDRALELLRAVGLAEAADKYPAQLSGGMQQRVALCRALAYGGDILLLDEPLKGLDRELRETVASLILDRSRGSTVLLVTHDPEEARLLADTTLHFRNGSFVPLDEPV